MGLASDWNVHAGIDDFLNLYKIIDRKKAIEKAIGLAKEGDLVLLTGKGSEQAICLANGKKLPWDEREVIKSILLKLGK